MKTSRFIVASLFVLVSPSGQIVRAESETRPSEAIQVKDESEPSGNFYRFIGEVAGWNIGENGKSVLEQCHEFGGVLGDETEAGTGERGEVSGKLAIPVPKNPKDVSERAVPATPNPLPIKSATVVRHVISAPYPSSYKKSDGRLVCAKKNDHPEKSKKNKKKHMDMECCLDPGEIPNPHCYYPPKKYGKYL